MSKQTRARAARVRRLIYSLGIIRRMKHLKKALDYYQHDVLTGLLDREGLQERIKHWGKLHRQNAQFAVAFVDLNNFKQVNDKYGHGCGDEALKMVADLLTASFRRKDELIARVGGDEFALFLPFTEGSALGNKKGKERHYEALSGYLISVMENDLKALIEANPSQRYMREIGFAVGVRVYRQKDIHRGLNKLLDEPDRAMYKIKQMQKAGLAINKHK